MIDDIFIGAFKTVLIEAWYLPLGFLLLGVFKLLKPKIKGAMGEYSLRHILKKLPKNNYKLMNDVLIETSSGTSQIDHIVISQFGVFIIENKNYKGWIFGDRYSKTWTQNIYGHKTHFQNPIHQNYGHIKRLQELDPVLSNINFISIIAFSGEATLKTNIENVTYYSKVIKLIKSYTEPIYNKSEIDNIYKVIELREKSDHKSRKKHIKSIKYKNK